MVGARTLLQQAKHTRLGRSLYSLGHIINKLISMNSSAQYGEDKIIDNYFMSTWGLNYKGTVLDIGANDGITYSNSYQFIKRGWKADLVEPSPKAFERLEQMYLGRAGVNLFNYAIGKFGHVTLYESGHLVTSDDIALVSTLLPEEIKKWEPYNTQFETVQVHSITFDYFKRLSGRQQWDFISIDAEGMDLEILKQIDLTAVGCKCLCIEYNGVQKEEFVAYAKSHGMFLHWINNVNLIFIR